MQRIVARRQCPKVLITGTHSTGKTTLIHMLVKELSMLNLRVVHESARKCPFALNLAQNHLSTMWLIAVQIKTEIEALTWPGTELVVCDRSIPDILGYHELASSERAGPWNTFAATWLQSYDHIFLTRPDPDRAMTHDELRLTSADYRHSIQQIIERHVTRSGVSYEILPRNPRKRIISVVTALRKMGVLS